MNNCKNVNIVDSVHLIFLHFELHFSASRNDNPKDFYQLQAVAV